jgi:uncharacterized membrane protein YqiK
MLKNNLENPNYDSENSENLNYRASSPSGGFGSMFLILIGFVLLIGPLFLPDTVVSGMGTFILCGLGLVILIIGTILYLLTKLYVKTPSNMAFVRTGMGGQKVILNGGAIFIPMFHELMEVLTETMKIVVNRDGPLALITKDNLRADVQIEFYIKVEKNEEAVIAAATSLGHKGINPKGVKNLVEEKLVSALRSVAAQSDLLELHADRQKFAEHVQELVTKELIHNGLTLEAVACSILDQANYANLDLNNIFNAQGAKTVAEKTNAALVAKNTIENDGRVAIATKNLETTQKTNSLKIDEEKSVAEKNKEITILQATNDSEARKNKAEQDLLAQKAEIEATEKMAVREQEKDKAIKKATVEKDQAIEVANLTKEQTVLVQTQEKEKAVQVAQVEKEKAVLQKGTERAIIEQKKSEAEKLATEAEQSVITAKDVAAAERSKLVTIKNQEAVAETTKINQNIQTDISAYKTERTAKANKTAAQDNAEAITVEAQADLKKKQLNAEGDTAIQMVPVNVAKAQVDVNAQQVEVTGKELKYKAEFSQVSITLETNLATINAEKEVGIEYARGLANAFSNANMNIWGDGTTAKDMFGMFTSGQGTFLKLKALENGGDSRNQVREEAKELVAGYLAGTKTALEVMGAADNVSTEVKSLVQKFVTSGGGNTLAGIGLMVKFLTGEDATKADMDKLEKLVTEFKGEK